METVLILLLIPNLIIIGLLLTVINKLNAGGNRHTRYSKNKIEPGTKHQMKPHRDPRPHISQDVTEAEAKALSKHN